MNKRQKREFTWYAALIVLDGVVAGSSISAAITEHWSYWLPAAAWLGVAVLNAWGLRLKISTWINHARLEEIGRNINNWEAIRKELP